MRMCLDPLGLQVLLEPMTAQQLGQFARPLLGRVLACCGQLADRHALDMVGGQLWQREFATLTVVVENLTDEIAAGKCCQSSKDTPSWWFDMLPGLTTRLARIVDQRARVAPACHFGAPEWDQKLAAVSGALAFTVSPRVLGDALDALERFARGHFAQHALWGSCFGPGGTE